MTQADPLHKHNQRDPEGSLRCEGSGLLSPPSAEPDLKAFGGVAGSAGIEANLLSVGFFSTGGAAVETGGAYDLPDNDPSGCKKVEYVVARNEQLVGYNPATGVL